MDGWRRDQWGPPTFGRYEELTDRAFKVSYADDDPNRVVHEEPIPRAEAEKSPRDALLGAGAVEKGLTAMHRRETTS